MSQPFLSFENSSCFTTKVSNIYDIINKLCTSQCLITNVYVLTFLEKCVTKTMNISEKQNKSRLYFPVFMIYYEKVLHLLYIRYIGQYDSVNVVTILLESSILSLNLCSDFLENWFAYLF